MGPEREHLQAPLFTEVSFHLPDGLNYDWNFADISLSPTDLLEKTRELAQQTQALGQESRLSAHEKDIPSIGEALAAEYPDLTINHGKTNFYSYDLRGNAPLQIPDWDNRDTIQRITDNKDSRAIEALTVLMRDSFKMNDDNQLDRAIHNPQNNIYLVCRENQYLGAFVLIYVPALYEVQLHSVAGLGRNPLISQERPKLPVLVSAAREAINRDFAFKERYSGGGSIIHYDGPFYLTFSASIVAPLYEKLGFQKSERGGISIKKQS